MKQEYEKKGYSIVKKAIGESEVQSLINALTVFSSRKATKPKHRRVIHLEYSAMSLPKPLTWYESIY